MPGSSAPAGENDGNSGQQTKRAQKRDRTPHRGEGRCPERTTPFSRAWKRARSAARSTGHSELAAVATSTKWIASRRSSRFISAISRVQSGHDASYQTVILSMSLNMERPCRTSLARSVAPGRLAIFRVPRSGRSPDRRRSPGSTATRYRIPTHVGIADGCGAQSPSHIIITQPAQCRS